MPLFPLLMLRDFSDPTPEQQNVILIDAATLHESQNRRTRRIHQ
jgi:hypothetical protein